MGGDIQRLVIRERPEKRCRTAFATAVQIRHRYDAALGKMLTNFRDSHCW
jgi:hypothetical protein